VGTDHLLKSILMKHKTGTFKNDDGTDIYYHCWLPKSEAKAVLLIVHGLGEHIGRYMNPVNYFVPKGFAVCGFDHPGHGRSGGEREVINSFDDFIHTLSIFQKMVEGWHSDKPLFLVGHSMGGLIAAYYLVDNQSAFKGAVLSSPLFKTNVPVATIIFEKIMGNIILSLAPKAGIMKIDGSGVSSDKQVVREYFNDPLVFHGRTPARLAIELLRKTRDIAKVAEKITLPVIVVQAEIDRLLDPKGAQIFYDKAGSKDKTLKVYKGFYHEVFNEPGKDLVFGDIEKWLDRHLEAEKDRTEGRNRKTVKRGAPGKKIKPGKD
jgi:acylglycerol lipase